MGTTEPLHCLQVLVPAPSGEGIAQNSYPLGVVTCFMSSLSTSMGFIGWQAPVASTVTLLRKSGPWGQDEAASGMGHIDRRGLFVWQGRGLWCDCSAAPTGRAVAASPA